jgi:hypothetical protein
MNIKMKKIISPPYRTTFSALFHARRGTYVCGLEKNLAAVNRSGFEAL